MVFDEEKGVLVNSKVLLMTSVYFAVLCAGIQFLETAKIFKPITTMKFNECVRV